MSNMEWLKDHIDWGWGVMLVLVGMVFNVGRKAQLIEDMAAAVKRIDANMVGKDECQDRHEAIIRELEGKVNRGG